MTREARPDTATIPKTTCPFCGKRPRVKATGLCVECSYYEAKPLEDRKVRRGKSR